MTDRIRIIQVGDYVKLGYDLIRIEKRNKYELTYFAKIKPNNPYKAKRVFNIANYETEIVLPKLLIFDDDPQYQQMRNFDALKFKVLGIFMRPRDKSSGEARRIISYNDVFVQRMLDKKGYYFLLEENINNQLFTIKAMYLIPCQ